MSWEDRVVRYVRSGDSHLAYMVVGEGPVELVWASPGISNVEFWDIPLMRSVGERLSSFSRFITFD